MEKYNKIKELIDFWSEFEQKTGSHDLADFGRWLSCASQEGKKNALKGKEILSTETDDHMAFYKQMSSGRQFLTLLSRASRFVDFYMKKAFEELEITSRLEFQFLVSIKEMKNPRKTDVIYFNLVEISTGVETLKRLQKGGMVLDFPDESDKRIKRLKLTEKGEMVLSAALEKFELLDQLVQSFGKDESWQAFIPSLTWFNDFHNEIYFRHKDRPFNDLMALILSSK
ncbi:MAG: MarR family winged helix-turn-helix transcriptional regulator [Bacteroidota bacterium]